MFWLKKEKKVDLKEEVQNIKEIDRQADIVETITNAISKRCLRTSDTKVKKSYDQGLLYILVSQFGSFLFGIEINFERKGQELKVDWGSERGSEFINMHCLGKLFLKISLNFP